MTIDDLVQELDGGEYLAYTRARTGDPDPEHLFKRACDAYNKPNRDDYLCWMVAFYIARRDPLGARRYLSKWRGRSRASAPPADPSAP